MFVRFLTFTSLIILISSCSTLGDNSTTVTPVTPEPTPIVLPVVNTTPLTLRGAEPFWTFVQSATGSAIFSLPGDPSVEEYSYTTTEVLAGTDIVITATPVLPGGTPISALVSPGTCSDGMSDIVYSYTVNLSYGINSYVGCGQ